MSGVKSFLFFLSRFSREEGCLCPCISWPVLLLLILDTHPSNTGPPPASLLYHYISFVSEDDGDFIWGLHLFFVLLVFLNMFHTNQGFSSYSFPRIQEQESDHCVYIIIPFYILVSNSTFLTRRPEMWWHEWEDKNGINKFWFKSIW